MSKIKLIALSIILSGFFLLLFNFTAEATLKHRKQTGKKCLFCHTGIPEHGDEDPQLSEQGKKFKENGSFDQASEGTIKGLYQRLPPPLSISQNRP
jgi:hypothetical protein